MVLTHTLGFPRFGRDRELKRAQERYWHGAIDRQTLEATGRALRVQHWLWQSEAGIDLLPVGDFSFYDGVLDMAALLGVIPERFRTGSQARVDTHLDLDTYFRMARGRAPSGPDVMACEMTKWFDTNYHYIVPELAADQRFRLGAETLFEQVDEAHAQGHRVTPVLIGPVTFLWLSKARGGEQAKLALLDRLLPAYRSILERLAGQGVDWVQLDEPILATDLEAPWRAALEAAYRALGDSAVETRPRLLLAHYFGPLGPHLELAASLSVDGLHADLTAAPEELDTLADALGPAQVLSAGVIDGRNVWATDLEAWLPRLERARKRLGDRLWIAPSCSLLHVPLDVERETHLDPELRGWLAFALQKLEEVAALGRALNDGRGAAESVLARNRDALASRRRSARIHRSQTRERAAAIDDAMAERSQPYAERAPAQHAHLRLPAYPTTTIGSFPQTAEIRRARRRYRAGEIAAEVYHAEMRGHIEQTVRRQERLELDVLVHGEPERNDMVEYFGELLDGFCFTRHGWVQSFGSRGVKPPIIYGDVRRPAPMTVDWSRYAQSLTRAPLKAMLTGPVTILQWSFARDDQPRRSTCEQIALALREEVADLETAGLSVVQIDEPAFREGLPLRRAEWSGYLAWATRAFRLAAAVAQPRTQIHTHMCYSEFNDIIDAIAELDADVITIETSRSQMELLDAFVRFEYPNEIGPGVYDIHSPRVPEVDEMVALLERARELIPAQRLWVNPDCGLKTRSWEEVQPALANMVTAAQRMRI